MRRLTFTLAALAVAATFTAGPALASSKGTDRPLRGTSTSATTLDLGTGTGSSVGSGQISHLGRFTFTNDITSFTLAGNATTISLIGTIVAANGDEVHTTATGTGTLDEVTLVSTVVGGTGRFADASGTLTSTTTNDTLEIVGATVTATESEVHEGRVGY
jgi:hypothetical protein